ncbi:hypothetical protein U2I54_16120 [Bacillus pseudomycoides]|uniref:Uncharacterized protein n=1 Tax=Bacillus bingmayongensis TaxID=1150157 RepID=A0ABU5JZU2_9BACI|nr:hypothetical protein [Bacillus pseudomycoides]
MRPIKLKTLKINGETIECIEPKLYRPELETFDDAFDRYQKEAFSWHMEFIARDREDFMAAIGCRAKYLVEFTTIDGISQRGYALFTSFTSESDGPTEYTVTGISQLETVSAPVFPNMPTFHMKDLHGKQVTLYYGLDITAEDNHAAECLIAMEDTGGGKKRAYVLSSTLKEVRK